MCDEDTVIFIEETQQQLKKEHDELLKKCFKLLFIKKLLLESKVSNKEEELDTALKILRVGEYLHDNLLDLKEQCSGSSLPHDMQKHLEKLLWKTMQKRFDTIEPLMKKLRNDFPDLFEEDLELNTSSSPIPTGIDEVLTLDTQRRDYIQKLAEIHDRKLKLLKSAVDVKFAPGVVDKVEIKNLKLSISQEKANLFRNYMIKDYLNYSRHALKAIKFVEKHVDELANEDTDEEALDKK